MNIGSINDASTVIAPLMLFPTEFFAFFILFFPFVFLHTFFDKRADNNSFLSWGILMKHEPLPGENFVYELLYYLQKAAVIRPFTFLVIIRSYKRAVSAVIFKLRHRLKSADAAIHTKIFIECRLSDIHLHDIHHGKQQFVFFFCHKT